MNERNPFEKESRLPEHEPALEVAELLDEFRRQARLQIEYANPLVPDKVKDAVRSSLDLLDLREFQECVLENRFDLYSNKTPAEQLRTYLQIDFIGRHLGDLKQDVHENEKLSTGEKLAFSNLLTDIEELAGKLKS